MTESGFSIRLSRKGGQKREDWEFILEVISHLIVFASGLPVLSS